MNQTPFHYVPGRATALASASVGILIGVVVDHPVVDELLEILDDGAGVDDVLDALLRGGLRSLPEFACAQVTDAGMRVVVRGVFTATPDAAEPMRAASAPWLDAVVATRSIVLRGEDPVAGRRVPFRGGVVLAAELLVTAKDAATPIARPPVAPTAVVPPLVVPTAVVPPAVATGVAPDAVAPDAVAEMPRESRGPEVLEVLEGLQVRQPPHVAEAIAHDATPPLPAPAIGKADVARHSAASDETGEQPLDFDFLFSVPGVKPLEVSVPDEAPAEEAHIAAASAGEPVRADPAMTSPSVLTAELPLWGPAQASVSASGLIEGLPWGSPAATEVAAPKDHLRDAPVPPLGAEEEQVSRTVNRAQLRGAAATTQSVLAVRCPHGHLSPAFAAECRVCRTPVAPQQHFEAPRPTLGVLRVSTGAVVTLDRGAILGRNPRVPPDHQGAQPNLVQVVDPGRDVSSQHLEVSLDFWNVVVRDLGSTNGTEVVLPGAMPVALRPNQPMILEPGSKVVMAGTVSFVFEATA